MRWCLEVHLIQRWCSDQDMVFGSAFDQELTTDVLSAIKKTKQLSDCLSQQSAGVRGVLQMVSGFASD